MAATTRGAANDVPLHRATPVVNSPCVTYVLTMSDPGAAMVTHGPVLLHEQTWEPSCAATAITWSAHGTLAPANPAGQYGWSALPSLPAAATTTRSSSPRSRPSAYCSSIGGWLSSVNAPSERLTTSAAGSLSSATASCASVHRPLASSTLTMRTFALLVADMITPVMKLACPTSASVSNVSS